MPTCTVPELISSSSGVCIGADRCDVSSQCARINHRKARVRRRLGQRKSIDRPVTIIPEFAGDALFGRSIRREATFITDPEYIAELLIVTIPDVYCAPPSAQHTARLPLQAKLKLPPHENCPWKLAENAPIESINLPLLRGDCKQTASRKSCPQTRLIQAVNLRANLVRHDRAQQRHRRAVINCDRQQLANLPPISLEHHNPIARRPAN